MTHMVDLTRTESVLIIDSGNDIGFSCDLDDIVSKYELLMTGESVEFEGCRSATFKLSSRDFKKNRTKMSVLNPLVRLIVEKDEKLCIREIKKYETMQGDYLKAGRSLENATARTKKAQPVPEDEMNRTERIRVETGLTFASKRINKLNESKLKSKSIGMLCELACYVGTHEQCPGCQDEFPCCDGECRFSKTLLSLVERTDGGEFYSDDEDESDLKSEESVDESFESSEYDSFDKDMLGKSEEEDDTGSSDEDYDANRKKKKK